ncbi:MAG: alanine racemase [Lentisphaerota bacterium]
MNGPWVEVDLKTLDENIRRVNDVLRPGTSAIFVVKADAYGHGLGPVVQRAAKAGIQWFAVAYLHEAVAVRNAAPDANILVIGAVDPSMTQVMIEQRITPVVVSEEHGAALSTEAQKKGARLAVHLKVDTGMGRLGLPWDHAAEIFTRLSAAPGLDLQGLCTHFASIELKKPSLGPTQMERFAVVDREIARIAGRRLFRHVSSSRAILYHADWDMDGIRPGILLYGYGSNERGMRFHTRPFLQWKTRVAQAKKVPADFRVGYYSTYVTPAPTTIVTLAVGYADGYNRMLSNKGFVLIHGRRCPVVGRVSMNWISADAGPDADVKMGDEVVLMGTQGQEAVWADELARLAKTIPYEILTGIKAGLDHHYLT